MFLHQNHGAGGGNSSVMVGMFVCLYLARKKPSEQEVFVPEEMKNAMMSNKAMSTVAPRKN